MKARIRTLIENHPGPISNPFKAEIISPESVWNWVAWFGNYVWHFIGGNYIWQFIVDVFNLIFNFLYNPEFFVLCLLIIASSLLLIVQMMSKTKKELNLK